MSSQQAKVFAERSFPNNFPIAIQSEKCSAHTERVNVSGRWITNRGCPTDPMRRYVAEVHIEAMLPEEFPCIGIKTHHALLFSGAFLSCVLQVNATVHHNRR
jgi:hypothetical protein